jgi:hypothetical protein
VLNSSVAFAGISYNLNVITRVYTGIYIENSRLIAQKKYLYFLLLAHDEIPSGAHQARKGVVVHFFGGGVGLTYKPYLFIADAKTAGDMF